MRLTRVDVKLLMALCSTSVVLVVHDALKMPGGDVTLIKGKDVLII
jgi:hypothetical protein